jgi:hypothetical protein
MKRILVWLIFFCTFTTTYAEPPSSIFVGKPWHSRLNFEPLLANPFEGRVGAMYQFEDNKLRLDIGNSLDLYRFEYPNTDFTIGADFYTFTRLRSEGNFKFPVETSDYFFGVNLSTASFTGYSIGANLDSYSEPEPDHTKFSARLRLAHISSHLVDGLADKTGLLNPTPFVYSREFADLVVALELDEIPLSINRSSLRAYVGTTAVWATQPRDANRFIPQLGLEYKYRVLKEVEAFAAYDFKLIGINDIYVGTNAWQVGVRGATRNAPTLSLNIYGYHGRSMHGMFYKEKDSYIGTGFQFMF